MIKLVIYEFINRSTWIIRQQSTWIIRQQSIIQSTWINNSTAIQFNLLHFYRFWFYQINYKKYNFFNFIIYNEPWIKVPLSNILYMVNTLYVISHKERFIWAYYWSNNLGLHIYGYFVYLKDYLKEWFISKKFILNILCKVNTIHAIPHTVLATI